MTDKTRKSIDRILDREWTAASAAGDTAKLEILRGAMERHAMGVDGPVLVRDLTPRQVERLADTFIEVDPLIATGRTWILSPAGTIEDLIDEREYHIDSGLGMIFENIFTDISTARESFITRSVTRSVDSAIRRMRAAL